MTKKKTKVRRKDPNLYPPGWDYRRTKAIADYYDKQNAQEFVAEFEAAFDDPRTVMVPVPHSLGSDVLRLIDRKKCNRKKKTA
jgi:hypothetical protein